MKKYRFALLPFWLLFSILLLPSCNVIKDQFWTGRESQVTTADDSGILLTLWVDHYCYKEGESIIVRFTLENTSDNTITLEGNDGPAANIVAYEENRNHTVSWAETDGKTEASNTIELESGETYEIEWNMLPPAFTGYEIRGIRVRYGAEFYVPLNVNYPPCRGG